VEGAVAALTAHLRQAENRLVPSLEGLAPTASET
jgi:hypothetical protein